MSASVTEVEEVLRQLRASPKHFKTVAKGLSDAQATRPPGEGSWSLHEVLAHVRGAADVQGGWIIRMIEEDSPSIRYASPRTGMRKGNYVTLGFWDSLAGYEAQRKGLVKRLTSLPHEAWLRGATFTGTTPGWSQTVYEAAHGIATHERSHFEQATAAAAVT